MKKRRLVLIGMFAIICVAAFLGNKIVSNVDHKAKTVEKTKPPETKPPETKPAEMDPPETDPIVVEPTVTAEEMILTKIKELQTLFPKNTYWNHTPGESYSVYATTQTPCEHDTSAGWKCDRCNQYVGVSNQMYQEQVSGIQCLGFASLCSDYIVVGECNADYMTCVIGWGRKIYRSQLGKSAWFITRYH